MRVMVSRETVIRHLEKVPDFIDFVAERRGGDTRNMERLQESSMTAVWNDVPSR